MDGNKKMPVETDLEKKLFDFIPIIDQDLIDQDLKILIFFKLNLHLSFLSLNMQWDT